MICDFGLSRVIDSDKVALLTEICGTPGVSPDVSDPSRGLLGPILVHGTRDLFEE